MRLLPVRTPKPFGFNPDISDRKQQLEDLPMAEREKAIASKEPKPSWQIYEESRRWRPQVDDGRPRQSEDDQQREQFGPRGVPGRPDPAKMVPQLKKKTPASLDPGHTA
jgi:hypothetical protein